jgi:hypothetical protein
MHAVRHLRWDVTDAVELAEAFAAGAAMLRSVLDAGPYHPSPWRLGAGLPDAGGTGRP